MPDHASSGIQKPCCNEHLIPVMLIMTSNAPDTMYLDKMKNYQQTLSAFVGPTEILISGGLGRLAAQVLQVHVKDSFFGGVENMDHNKKKVLVTIPVTQEQRNLLVEKGAGRCELTFLPAAEVSAELLADQDALIGNLAPDRLKNTGLQWVQLNSAGADAYTPEGILSPDCILTTAVGAYGLAVSEHMIALTFAMVRRLGQYARGQMQHTWEPRGQISSVEGSTVLILGLGDIGGSYARKMKALGARTIGLRRRNTDCPEWLDVQDTIDRLDEYLPQADIVAMVLPGGKATYHMMNDDRIRRMKKGACLLNAGRGTAIDPAALEKALRQGHLACAALDVTEPEPLPADSPLWDMDNLILTPHVAGGFYLPETVNRIIRIAADNLDAWLKNAPMRNVTSHA